MAESTMISQRTVSPSARTGSTTKKKSSSVRQPTPVRQGSAVPRQNLTNMFEFLRNSPQSMQVSKQGVSYRNLDPNAAPEDPGYLRPPTREDIEYGDRLRRAQELKASSDFSGGQDPAVTEQRITAAERQSPYWKDQGDSLRESIYGKGPVKQTLSNMGNMLTNTYTHSLGKMVPFAFLPGGSIYNASWSAQPNQAEGWDKKRILMGEGTPSDRHRAWDRSLDLYKHQYYGQPDPGPRPWNVYDDLGMSQPKYPVTHMMDYGQNDVPLYLKSIGRGIDRELGPAKVPPPGSDLGLPAGALDTRGASLSPYLNKETRDLVKSGFPVENLPPEIQDFVENTMEKPPSYIDLSGGRGRGQGRGGEEGDEDESKKRFNLLEILLGLLGLPLKLLGLTPPGEEKEKKANTGAFRQPREKSVPWQTQNKMNRQNYTAQQARR